MPGFDFSGRGPARPGLSKAHTSKAQNSYKSKNTRANLAGEFSGWENSNPGIKGFEPKRRGLRAVGLPLTLASSYGIIAGSDHKDKF